MPKPSIKYLVSSPHGDIPADRKKWHLPLEGDAVKTPYRVYFQYIKDFLAREDFRSLLYSANKKLGKEIHLKDVKEIIVRSEKHGFLYHPSSIEVILKEGTVKFGLNVAISEIGKNWLREEFSVLKRLNKKFNLSYLPRAYFFSEHNSMSFLLEDWFEGYHEFHISRDQEGKQRIKLWDFHSGYKYLSQKQCFEIYKHCSKILTHYYDFRDSSQIINWHHAAGDFVVKIEDEVMAHPQPNPPPSRRRENKGNPLSRHKESIRFVDKDSPSTGVRGLGGERINVRLTTARQYEPILVLRDKDPVNPFLGLFCFFLNMTLRMRLDKLDGLGEVVWADDICLDATAKGFIEALKLKDELKHYVGSVKNFLKLLKSFGEEELKITFNPIIDLYIKEKDLPILIENLGKHVRKLYIILQTLPL